ncbi:MAG: hypothetical protein AAF349_19635 [Cyanobacteria bacterium P01_A01_bin.68]
MSKGRPGGNPEIAKHGFKQKFEWDEPCSEIITIRVPSSMKAAIKAGVIKNWQEMVRQAIAAEIEKATQEEDTQKGN